MDIPSDYRLGFEKARAIAPDVASNYVAHTLIGDPLCEAMLDDLAEFSERSIQIARGGDEQRRRGSPS